MRTSLRKLLSPLVGKAAPPAEPVAPAPSCVVSVVIGSYNRKRLLPHTIDSVRNNGMPFSYEIIVIDGGSTDGTLDWLVAQRDIVTIVQHNRGEFRGRPIRRRSWGYFMNLGFKAAQGKYVLMISDDCLLLPGAMQCGVETFEKGLHSGQRLGGLAFYFRNWPEEQRYYVQHTLGGKLMVNHGLFLRSALEQVGFVDEERYLFYKADGDLCLKLWQQGYVIRGESGALVEHYFDAAEGIRRSNNLSLEQDRAAYLKRWQGIYYDPDKADPRGRLYLDFADQRRTAETVWGNLRAA